MSPQLLFNLQQGSPFIPFDLHLADGRVLHVGRSELLTTAADGQSFLLFQPPPHLEYFDPALVVSVRIDELAS